MVATVVASVDPSAAAFAIAGAAVSPPVTAAGAAGAAGTEEAPSVGTVPAADATVEVEWAPADKVDTADSLVKASRCFLFHCRHKQRHNTNHQRMLEYIRCESSPADRSRYAHPHLRHLAQALWHCKSIPTRHRHSSSNRSTVATTGSSRSGNNRRSTLCRYGASG
eukprot:COSAG03_NODE_3680_length_1881_cov_3.044893_3_plen_166_part_00